MQAESATAVITAVAMYFAEVNRYADPSRRCAVSSRRANVVRRSVAAKRGHWLKYDSAGPRQAGEANTNYLDVLTSISSAVTDEFGGVITNWPSPFFLVKFS